MGTVQVLIFISCTSSFQNDIDQQFPEMPVISSTPTTVEKTSRIALIAAHRIVRALDYDVDEF
ncbi:hypothetical protein HanRHA438_Chr16g0786851 [Helianthus annuus]|nr:hypothetical protein HanRHA438_Chr16g0786851 [Helianthus annuus]